MKSDSGKDDGVQSRCRFLEAVGRGMALFLGAFALMNVLGELCRSGFDANIWWVDLRPLPGWTSRVVLGVAGAVLVGYAVRAKMGRWRQRLSLGAVVMVLGVTLWNAGTFYVLMWQGSLRTGFPIAFSILMCVAAALVLWGMVRNEGGRLGMRGWAVVLTAAGVCAVGFPLGQMMCFGMTDYARPADAAVVFGAQVKEDGSLSEALEDRVRTACELYEDGVVRTVILSGGPGQGAIHETEGMRRYALAHGVPEEAIVCDRGGLNTQATVVNTTELLKTMGCRRVLAVSHFYHLPRIKMTYARAGLEVYTVPARERRRLRHLGAYMVREVAALWVYYLSGGKVEGKNFGSMMRKG